MAEKSKKSQAEIESKADAFDDITRQAEIVTDRQTEMDVAHEKYKTKKKSYEEENTNLLFLINDSKQSFPLLEEQE